MASDALAAGFGTIVLVLGPSTGPAIRYHVEHTWPAAVDVRFATPAGAARHRPRRAVARPSYVGDAPYGVGNADDIYGAAGCALAGRAPAGTDGDANALVGYRLADAVIGFSPVTRGICRVADDGRLLGVDERRQVHADAPTAASWPATAASPPSLSPDARVSMNLWGFTAGLPQDAPGRHGRRHRRLRGVRGPAARGGRPVARPPAPSPCCRPRAAASG